MTTSSQAALEAANQGDSAPRNSWGAPKRCRSVSLTDEAWGLLTRLADLQAVNRSECLERIIRNQCGITVPTQVN